MAKADTRLRWALDGAFEAVDEALSRRGEPRSEETGVVTFVGRGVVQLDGLPGVQSEELIRFAGGQLGLAFNLDRARVGVIMLDQAEGIAAGQEARRTARVVDVSVGEELLGRVVDAAGRPLDGEGPIRAAGRRPIEHRAPAIMDRAPVTVPLQTGIQVIDALVPIGRGQRELILGDRQTGKTTIALTAIINQRKTGVLCIYCAAGKRSSAIAAVVSDLRERGAIGNTIVVAATEEDPPGQVFVAPYAAMTMAEYFMEQGRDVLVVYDDLTRHARSYRELSLLLRRPPAREAYPGDIFYIHSRLLERSTHLRDRHGGGSITALPIVETQAQDIAAYIPTNLISITDGQIYLSPDLFQEGVLPAVDVGESVSRVGGKTQLPAYRAVAGDLRLAYSQFEELESFARFDTRLDEQTRKTLERGRRVREVLKQSEYETLPAPEQIALLLAVTEGLFDSLGLDDIPRAKQLVREAATQGLPDLCDRIARGEKLSDEDRQALKRAAGDATDRVRAG